MAAALVLMFRWHGRHGFGEWFSTADLLFRGHRLDADFSKLRFWGLIERHPEGAHRLYRITPAGVDFVGGGQVRKYTYTFDDRAIRRKNPDRSMITIRESLGDRFSLEELMRATPDGS